MAFRGQMRVHAPGGSPAPDNGSISSDGYINYKLDASDTTVSIWSKNAPYKFRVVDAYVVMHGAGAASDAVKIERGDGAASETFNDITDDLDVSSAGDTDILRFGELDDAQWEVDRDESLRITSTSGALCEVFIKIVPVS